MNVRELAVAAFVVLLGASLFMWAKPLASALNYWAAQQYVRFPKLKILPGARNAGTALNYKSTFIWFRICGTFICVVAVFFELLEFVLPPAITATRVGISWRSERLAIWLGIRR
jgi:hypothetical protein